MADTKPVDVEAVEASWQAAHSLRDEDCNRFSNVIGNAWPALRAELLALRRLRDAVAAYDHDVFQGHASGPDDKHPEHVVIRQKRRHDLRAALRACEAEAKGGATND